MIIDIGGNITLQAINQTFTNIGRLGGIDIKNADHLKFSTEFTSAMQSIGINGLTMENLLANMGAIIKPGTDVAFQDGTIIGLGKAQFDAQGALTGFYGLNTTGQAMIIDIGGNITLQAINQTF